MTKRLIIQIGYTGIVFPAFPLFRRFRSSDYSLVFDIADPAKYE